MAVDQAVADKLKSMQGAWQKARTSPIATGALNSQPDGKYHCMLTESGVAPSSAGDLNVRWFWTIMAGEHAASLLRKYDNIEKEGKFEWVMKDLKLLGMDIGAMTVEELPDALEFLVAHHCQAIVELKTNGNFQNLYVNKLVDLDGGEGSPAPTPEAADNTTKAATAPATAEPQVSDGLGIGDRVEIVVNGANLKGMVKGFNEDRTVAKVLAGGKIHDVPVDEIAPVG